MNNKDRVAGLYDAFAAGDIATVVGMFDPDIHWHEAEGNPYQPSGEAFVGPDSVVQNLFVKLGEDWSEFTVHPASIDAAGSLVVMQGRYAGVHAGTGKSLDCQVCHILTLDNGKITKFQQYTDTAQLREVMGA